MPNAHFADFPIILLSASIRVPRRPSNLQNKRFQPKSAKNQFELVASIMVATVNKEI